MTRGNGMIYARQDTRVFDRQDRLEELREQGVRDSAPGDTPPRVGWSPTSIQRRGGRGEGVVSGRVQGRGGDL